MIFSKEKMLKRLQNENKFHLCNAKHLKIMNALDGQTVRRNEWKYRVLDKVEYGASTKEGKYYTVNPADCIQKANILEVAK